MAEDGRKTITEEDDELGTEEFGELIKYTFIRLLRLSRRIFVGSLLLLGGLWKGR